VAYHEVPVWKCGSNSCTQSVFNTYVNTNSAKFNGGKFVVFDANGTIITTLYPSALAVTSANVTNYILQMNSGVDPTDPSKTTVSIVVKEKITDPDTAAESVHDSDVLGIMGQNNVASFDGCVPNYYWYEYQKSMQNKNIKNTDMLSQTTDPTMIQVINNDSYLVTQDCLFKLGFNTMGDFVLTYCTAAKIRKVDTSVGDAVNYTQSSDLYLYNVSADSKLNYMYYADDDKKIMQKISQRDNPILSAKASSYIKVGDFYPNQSQIDASTPVKSAQECKIKCTENTDCLHYFSFSKQGDSQFCYLNTKGSDDPNALIPTELLNNASSNTDIINSSLYIKEKTIEMESEYMPSGNFASAAISKLNGYSTYDSYTQDTVPLQAPQKLGVYQSDDYIEWEKKYKKQVYGSTGSEQQGFRTLLSYSSFAEGFQEYDANPCSSDDQGCIQNILDKKLTPIKAMSDQYYKNLQDIEMIDVSLNRGIANYKTSWNTRMNDPVYNFDNPTYDASKTQGRSLMDGRNDDVNYLLLQETDTLILGTIAVASLALFSIMLLMK
jgi:hypothetical protein